MEMNIFSCGDIVINSSRNKIVSDELRKIISSADISICNFEGPLHAKGALSHKTGPRLSQSHDAVKILKDSGFGLFSLANNHIMDFGPEGLEETLSTCKKEGISTVGAGMNREEAFKPAVIRKDGSVISVFGFAEREFGAIDPSRDKPGYAWISDPLALNKVRDAKKNSDIVIVCVHGGNENVPFPSIQTQTMLRNFIDNGVDVIIGHHPHVPQGWEEYKNRHIFYSLGNFFFDYPNGKIYPRFEWSICAKIVLKNRALSAIEIIPVERVGGQIVGVKREDRKKYLSYLDDLSSITSDMVKLAAFWQETAVYLFDNMYVDFLRKRHNRLLLLNLFRNESHRSAIETALSVSAKDSPDYRTQDTNAKFKKYLIWTKK